MLHILDKLDMMVHLPLGQDMVQVYLKLIYYLFKFNLINSLEQYKKNLH